MIPPTEQPGSESEITASAGGADQAAADDAELDALRGELLRELGRLAERTDLDEQ